MTQDPLTPRQHDVLTEIARLEDRGDIVMVRLVADVLTMPRQNVRTYAKALQKAGYILYDANERHASILRMTEAGRLALGQPPVPLALPIVGEVAAGQPTYAQEHVEGYATTLRDILDIHEGDFLLRVRGQSMIGIGIYPGDLVVIRPLSEEPNPGEITLVAVPGEDTATLKRWRRNNGTVTLFSENVDFAPMTFKATDVLVQGCLVGHIGTGRTRQQRTSLPRS